MRAFNLAKYPYQSNVIDNYRFAYRERYGVKLTVDDKVIWDTHEDLADLHEDDREVCILEELRRISREEEPKEPIPRAGREG